MTLLLRVLRFLHVGCGLGPSALYHLGNYIHLSALPHCAPPVRSAKLLPIPDED